MLSFLHSISDQIHLVAITPDGPTVGRDFGTDIARASAWAAEQNRQEKNIYFSVNSVREAVNKKPSKSDITAVRFAHIDIDPPKNGSIFDKEGILVKLRNAPIPPTMINWSGNGIQAFWRVTHISKEQVENINRALVSYFEGDVGTHNVDRLMRVPGFINYPNKKKRDQGRKPIMASILQEDNGNIFSYGELSAVYGQEIVKPEAITNISDVMSMLIQQPKGDDRSRDTLRFTCEALRQGWSEERIEEVLLNKDNPIAAHCLAQSDPRRAALRAIDAARTDPDISRRIQQRKEDKLIAAGKEADFQTSRLWTLEEMLERFVFVSDGSQVADINNPRGVLSFGDFKNLTAASQTLVLLRVRDGSSRMSPVLTANQWLKNPNRKEVQTVTFNPSGNLLTKNPDGITAINTWTGFQFDEPPDDWVQRAEPFESHIRWLWGTDADPFFDWLAHVAQCPGVLPSFGWLHIAKAHGMGRNWIAGVLGRVFQGVTALGVDLNGMLNSSYNGSIGSKVLAVVDEINEGVSGKVYQHSQTLKRIITEETRLINVKYGRQRVEHNACRWLIFSNSSTALPLEDEDRRFWVVRSDEYPKDEEYYSNLYALKCDPVFIASIAWWLKQRDITHFNPGARPRLTEAKRLLLDRTRSTAEQIMGELTESWPVDIITSLELRLILGDEMPSKSAMRYLLERVGWARVGRLTTTHVRLYERIKPTAYALRNIDNWKNASPEALLAEVNRATDEEKEV